jgi:hypothetical protein
VEGSWPRRPRKEFTEHRGARLDLAQARAQVRFDNGRMNRTMGSFPARVAAVAALCAASALAAAAPAAPAELAALYRTQVDRRLDVPPAELPRYARLVDEAFARAGVQPGPAQYVAVVDRDPQVQALLLLWRAASGSYELVGASPVSTGRPGSFDHFRTPTGVFDHSNANPDFRAEGTFNENNIRGYGVKDMRVFDFGWQRVPKGWGDGETIDMRLQMHATDPDALEQRLGSVQSKGCVRIPAALNKLLDRYGVLDADYDRLQRAGQKLWVLREDREPVADAGRYLVIVDSQRSERPEWSPSPFQPHRRAAPAARPVPSAKPAPPKTPVPIR